MDDNNKWSVLTTINMIVAWLAETIANLFENARKALDINSMSLMSACNPEIMENILDVSTSSKYVYLRYVLGSIFIRASRMSTL